MSVTGDSHQQANITDCNHPLLNLPRPTSEPLDTLEFHSPAASCLAPPNGGRKPLHKEGAGNQRNQEPPMSTRLPRAVSLLLQKNPHNSNRGPLVAYISCDQRRKHSWDAQKSPHTTLSHFSRVWLSATPWTVAHQVLLSLGFSRQEYWSGLPFPSPGSLLRRTIIQVQET